jgi:hypothetical protein
MNEQPRDKLRTIAFVIGILDAIFILFTIIRHIPALQAALQTPFPQVLKEGGLWFTLAEMLFYSAVLAALFGLISLWLPELRFILWAGTALVVVAGLLYLVAVVTYYQSQGMGPFIQQGGFMFLVSLVFPFIVRMLLKRMNR